MPALRTCCALFVICLPSTFMLAEPPTPAVNPIHVGRFPVEVLTVFTRDDGLPSNDVRAVAIGPNGETIAATTAGLARLEGRKWIAIPGAAQDIRLLAASSDGVYFTTADELRQLRAGQLTAIARLPEAIGGESLRSLAARNGEMFLGTEQGLFEVSAGKLSAVSKLNDQLGEDRSIRQIAIGGDGAVAVAAAAGLYLLPPKSEWIEVEPADGAKSWHPRDVRGVLFDGQGRLWFAAPAGAGMLDGNKWSLFTGHEGLPYNDFTTIAAGDDGSVWFGTKRGAIRFDGKQWSYRQGRRWTPHDAIRSIAVTGEGHALFATSDGVGLLERRPTTLADKARFFESEIDKLHRRTGFGFVLDVELAEPGDKSNVAKRDSDNDGLWTAMYGAGECFAFAATKDPVAKRRATQAFKALKFLSDVTQGGEHPAPRGFPARSILPTSGPDPNLAESPGRDRRMRLEDPRWKKMELRWPKSADGKWYWKSDTSSDELDGHFFMYLLYFDLVAETDAEKRPVREVVAAIADHLIEHDFDLIDHDGQPTRWGRFNPKLLNDISWAPQRGLNSLSILAYLAVAEHVTGEKRFADAFRKLAYDESYLTNMYQAKVHFGPGTGNQSDDEMAFMCFYALARCQSDPKVREACMSSMQMYWIREAPERNPFFNGVYAATYAGGNRFGRTLLQSGLDDAVDALRRFPLDRFDWRQENSHRLDVVPMSNLIARFSRSPRGHLRDGRALPVDERFFTHWNHNPWSLDTGREGRRLADGAVFLLPYYLLLYHGLILEDAS